MRCIAAFGAGIFLAAANSQAAAVSPAVVITNGAWPTFVITLRQEANLDGLVAEHGLKPRFTYRHALKGFAAELSPEQVARLTTDPRTLAVEADGMAELCGQTVPTGVARMNITNFPVAHINGTDHRIDVDVAILDTGIQTNHPDLNVFRSVGFTPSGIVDDTEGHGTHVAGIVGALDNDIGVVGVAPGVRLWSVKYADTREGTWSQALAAMDYIGANANRIAVVNASFGGGTAPITAIHQAVLGLVNRGVVFVAAAGNNHRDIAGPDGIFGTPDDFMPAAFPEVMAVSAIEPTLVSFSHRAGFSNFSFIPHSPAYVSSPGAAIDVAAPGVDILSTAINSSYVKNDGTSVAAPHVTGLVALYIAANGRAHSAAEVYRIRQAIIDHSLPQTQWPIWYYGLPPGDPDDNPEPLAMPSEHWVPQPNFTAQRMAADGFQCDFITVPGYTYTIQYRDLPESPGVWTNLLATNGVGKATSLTITNAATNAARFYRLLRQPAP